MNGTESMDQELNRLLARSEWCKHARLSITQHRINQLRNTITWAELKSQLYDKPADLIEILSQVMPLRHAVWWALLCGVAVEGFAFDDASSQCINAALNWVQNTDEPRRLHARSVSESTDWKLAEGLLARAVAWSSGSILPETIPVFSPPPPGVTGHMIAGAVLSFAARNTCFDFVYLLAYYIRLAEGVMNGAFFPEGWHSQNLSNPLETSSIWPAFPEISIEIQP